MIKGETIGDNLSKKVIFRQNIYCLLPAFYDNFTD